MLPCKYSEENSLFLVLNHSSLLLDHHRDSCFPGSEFSRAQNMEAQNADLETILELNQIGYICGFPPPFGSYVFNSLSSQMCKGYMGSYSCSINIGHEPKMIQVLPTSFSELYSSLFNNALSHSSLMIFF